MEDLLRVIDPAFYCGHHLQLQNFIEFRNSNDKNTKYDFLLLLLEGSKFKIAMF